MAKKVARPKGAMKGPGTAGPVRKGGKQAARRLVKPGKAAPPKPGTAAKSGGKAAVKSPLPFASTSAILAPPASGLARPPDAGRSEVLDRLWAVVMARREADPAVSHSARLLSRGTAKVAQKFGEEAVECLIEAVAGNRAALVAESADVLYHLLVMWVDAGIQPAAVWAELERREGVSGIAEKASRRVGLATTKIP